MNRLLRYLGVGFAEPIVTGLLITILSVSLLFPELATDDSLWPPSRVVAVAVGRAPSAAATPVREDDETASWDVVIYGGTSGGVIAAVQARELGMSVLLIEPSEHLGGLTSGGLGATDIGNKGAIGGLSREFYRRIKEYYSRDESWVQERSADYRGPHRSAQDDAMWTFEPRVAEDIYRAWIADCGATLWTNERLVRSGQPGTAEAGVELEGNRIARLRLESGRIVQGSMFIDATYEGDLLAEAGVSYVVGREANAVHGETLNGVQTAQATKHQIQPGVDPYREPGNPASGLLPGIDPLGPGTEGAGDHRVQAYCLRMCVTDVPENQIPFAKPENYDESLYELLLRNFEAGERREPWNPILMPNRKTDANNNHGVSSDWIGMSYDWAEASYEERAEIYRAHRDYQEGLMWTLANHPRVPEAIRRGISRWGNCRDEFVETDGWSHQLYVREARRMVGSVVMTQHHCQGRQRADDAVGLAAYTMDSHNVQRYVDERGFARNEGDVQVGGFPPYPIAYGAITPKRSECGNLLVPVALSASHIAYGSIRMEPGIHGARTKRRHGGASSSRATV
ncbi:MAG: FAD-dependent oxidoreductase [Pirellulaceae bacterium]